MFVFVLLVPALLVVVLGYVLGHRLWTWLGGLVDDAAGTSLTSGAEAAGWVTGLLLLVALLWWAVSRARGARSRSTRPTRAGRRGR